MSTGLVGVGGFAYLSGGGPALKIVGHTTMRSVTDWKVTRTTAAVFTVLIGALLFGCFLTITQGPQKVTAFLTGLA